MRKNFLKYSFFITVGFLTACRSYQTDNHHTQQESPKPNIIYILADDLGYGDVGFNGQVHMQTPNIDRLAAEGMVLRQHYAGSTVCGPSRSALMTGQHTGHTTVRGNPTWTLSGNPVDLKPDDITVAEELKRAGYVNGLIGKWGLDETFTNSHPNDQGFDHFFGYRTHMEAHHYYPEFVWRNKEKVLLEGNHPAQKTGQYTHDLFTRESLDFIRNHKDNPFFLYVAYTVPHYELTVPEDSKAPFVNKGWPERPMKAGHYHHDPEGNTTYAGMVARLDRDVGQIMALLKELALEENTLVIFTSDNGPVFDNGFFNSNGPFRGMKRDLYEGGIRVPFAARWPGTIPAGSQSFHVSAFWDFLPTACAVAGVEPTAETDGVSYLPTLLGKPKEQQSHAYLYWEFNENEGPLQAVRKDSWKGISLYGKPFELYNLAADPGESRNIASQHPEMVQQLETLMAQSRTEHPEFPLTKRKSN